jgi:MFS family permease
MLGLGSIPGTVIGRWLGARRLVTLMGFGIGASSLVRLLPPQAFWIFLGTILLSLSASLVQPAIAVLIRRWFSERLDRASSIYSNGLLMGGTIGASATPLVARAVGWRSYRPLFPHVGRAKVNQLALEFASREMAEIEILRELPDSMDVAVGLVDVKNTWVEPASLVADRLRTVLKHVDPSRVSVTPDCGFSQTARFIAIGKAKAMAEGVRLVRSELGGS